MRAFAVLVMLVIAGQAMFDHCLVDCHGPVPESAAHCHQSASEETAARFEDASTCGHDHSRLWLDDAESAPPIFKIVPAMPAALAVFSPAPLLSPAGGIQVIHVADIVGHPALEFPLRR